MYVLVFVVLLMSVLGVYTEIFTVQTAKFYANQKAIAQTMVVWHRSAVALAKATASISSGCRLSTALATFGNCPSVLPTNTTYLPTGYNTANYVWPSAYYTVNGQGYVITYVQPSATGAVISTPSIGITPTELLMQLKQTDLDPITYGYVFSGQLVNSSQPQSGTTMLSYPVTTTIVDHSIAIVTPIP